MVANQREGTENVNGSNLVENENLGSIGSFKDLLLKGRQCALGEKISVLDTAEMGPSLQILG